MCLYSTSSSLIQMLRTSKAFLLIILIECCICAWYYHEYFTCSISLASHHSSKRWWWWFLFHRKRNRKKSEAERGYRTVLCLRIQTQISFAWESVLKSISYVFFISLPVGSLLGLCSFKSVCSQLGSFLYRNKIPFKKMDVKENKICLLTPMDCVAYPQWKTTRTI